nr:hypothetical protein [Aeromicrobium sp.]
MGYPMGDSEVVDRGQVPDLGHFVENLLAGGVDAQPGAVMSPSISSTRLSV